MRKKTFLNGLSSIFIALGCLSFIHSARASGQVPNDQASPLFGKNEVLELTLKSDFPYRGYHGKPKLENLPKFPATLIYDWNGHRVERTVKVQARGSGRLNHCEFAPIKLHLKNTDENDLFAGVETDIKVVTHCLENERASTEDADRFLLKEYLLYKILKAANISTFNVRLARIRYVSSDNQEVAHRYAFFIEPVEHYVSQKKIISKAIDEKYFEKLVLEAYSVRNSEKDVLQAMANFQSKVDGVNNVENNLGQLLILNDDWMGATRSPNTKNFQTQDGSILSVHYDFDLSNLVRKFGVRNSRQVHTFPATFESDLKWILSFCMTDRPDDIPVEKKRKACPNVIREMLSTKDGVERVISEFEMLSAQDRQEILNRAKVFYRALMQAEVELQKKK